MYVRMYIQLITYPVIRNWLLVWVEYHCCKLNDFNGYKLISMRHLDHERKLYKPIM